MKQGSSNRRVNEQAREVISEILLFEISDPRLAMVTITGVEVSFDRSVANVYYSTEPSRYTEVAQAFNAAAGRIRSLMAKKLSWRVAPELRFYLDESVDNAQRIAEALLADAPRNADSTADANAGSADIDATADADAGSADAATTENIEACSGDAPGQDSYAQNGEEA